MSNQDFSTIGSRRLPVIEDLSLARSSKEISIFGHTKNLDLLKGLNPDTVWLTFVNQKSFDRIASLINPEKLFVYAFKVQDLSSFQKFTRLTELSLEWNTKCRSLDELSKLKSLTKLRVMDFSKCDNIKAVGHLAGLEFLEIGGGVDSVFKIHSMAPLATLSKLQRLVISNARVIEGGLNPIKNLTQLESATISNQFDTEDFALLSVYLEKTDCSLFQPYIKFDKTIGENDIMIVGKRKPFLNSVKDKDRIESYVRKFQKLQEAFRKIKTQENYG